MKKVLFMCAALVAAMSIHAEITEMTCAEAAAAAAKLGETETGSDSVAVTGYITNTDGKISSKQQTFWMDDQKGSTKTFEGYWADLPQECLGDPEKPLNVGDKIVMKGFLQRYYSTYEMKNGDVTILERAVVKYDTTEVSTCEAVDECDALSDGDNTNDYFNVTDVVTSLGDQNETYHTQQFYFTCADNSKTLQAYNVTIKADEGVYAAIGDTVQVIGRLKKYGTTLEILGNAWIIGKGSVKIDTISCGVDSAVVVGKALAANLTTNDVYRVTGYVDSIAYAYSEEYGNMSFYMCDDMANPKYEFEAYKVNVSQDVPVGAKVTVTGRVKHYVSSSTEAELVEIESGECEIIELPQGIEEVAAEVQGTQKMLYNGNLYIVRDGVMYTTMGQAVR